MIVRKIEPEELKRTNELFAIAFECEIDNTKTAKQVYEEVLTNPQSREDAYWDHRWAAFLDDNQTMTSYFVAKPYPVQFDNHPCTFTGIGGVASLPQYRRMGGIRKCFESALPDMYKNGYEFSYLYPFSTAYYRKFGYELCCEKIRYQIKLSAVPSFSLDGNCFLLEKGSNFLEDIKQIYKVWQNKYNMMVINEDYEYAWVENSNPSKDQHFTYIYKTLDGTPKGFITFQKVDNGTVRNINCSRLMFTDLEGFKGLMNLMRSLASDHEFLTFVLPTDQSIVPLFPEWSMGAGKRELLHSGMVRVINVEKVLTMAKYKGDGDIVIEVSDAIIPQNNNRFYINYKDGEALLVTPTKESPHIVLGIQDFSRLITGACDTSDIPFMELVQINSTLDKIAPVFYKKPVLITEYF